LLAHVQLFLHQYSQLLLGRTALNAFIPQPLLIAGVALTQMQDLALGLVEPHEIHTGPFLELIQVTTRMASHPCGDSIWMLSPQNSIQELWSKVCTHSLTMGARSHSKMPGRNNCSLKEGEGPYSREASFHGSCLNPQGKSLITGPLLYGEPALSQGVSGGAPFLA